MSSTLQIVAPSAEESKKCFPDLGLRLRTRVVTGREQILAYRERLVRLSERYGLYGAMDQMEYFLLSLDALKKTPHLVVIENDTEMVGALLIQEYRVLGRGVGVYATDDASARRNLLAPPYAVSLFARLAAEALMGRGARMVMQSVQSDGPQVKGAPGVVRGQWVFTTRSRMWKAYLPLKDTLDETLAEMGQKTRFNLRYYRRRAVAKLGANFAGAVTMDLAEMQAFNKLCANPVSEEMVAWRHDGLMRVPGMFLCGIRDKDGEWLSLIGGWRSRDVVEIGWQLNRGAAELLPYSLSTVLRSFFIEDEIARGTRRMYIHGGTPHSMQNWFAFENGQDVIVVKSFWMKPLRLLARRVLPGNNFCREILLEERLPWKPWPQHG